MAFGLRQRRKQMCWKVYVAEPRQEDVHQGRPRVQSFDHPELSGGA
jgi:hypothetical protein